MMLFTIPFWIVCVTCLFWYSNYQDLKPVKNSLYFLLFPLVFFNIPKAYFSKEKLNFYFEILKYVVFIISISYFLAFFYFYDYEHLFQYKYEIPKFRDFIYHEIPFFRIHPTYFTSILIFTTGFSALKIITEKKWSEIIFVLTFMITSIVLLAKLNMVFLVLMLVFIIIFKFKIAKRYKALAIILLFIGSVGMIKYVPGVKNRFVEIVNSYNNPPEGMSYDSTNIRMAIFNCSKQIAEDNFITGVGFTNAKNVILDCFKSNYDSEFYKDKKYLTHNYFMYMLISSGIFGLLFFLYYIITIIRFTLKINSFLLYVVVLNVLLVCLIEDFFYRQFGLFYFSLLFYSFLNSKQDLLFNKEEIFSKRKNLQ
ncbi:O-antigen ligase family protein [uncultured Flavobacterium sp.]|uniref:O-antigen ligase family protein n=1 Tax=uncultured Flavobacterium sp. TaxID=165435 RepID=UPI0030EF0F94